MHIVCRSIRKRRKFPLCAKYSALLNCDVSSERTITGWTEDNASDLCEASNDWLPFSLALHSTPARDLNLMQKACCQPPSPSVSGTEKPFRFEAILFRSHFHFKYSEVLRWFLFVYFGYENQHRTPSSSKQTHATFAIHLLHRDTE